MDKQILYQYIDACELIRETEEEIRRIKRQRKRIEQDVVKGSSRDFPYTPTNFHVEGLAYTVIRDPRSLEVQEKILDQRKAAAEEIKLRSRQYAKRQLTWFRRNSGAKWLYWDSVPDFAAALQASTGYIKEFGI